MSTKPNEALDMFSMLSRMLGGPGARAPVAPGMGIGGAPLIEGASLMGSLTTELVPLLAEAGNLQNVLRKLKGTNVGAGMGQVDAMTLEIVSMLFDALFEDPKVSLAVKGLIGRMQLPMLKVAIADKELFSSKSHPARLLLDALGQLGVRLPRELPADHPTYRLLERHVDALVHGYQDNLESFDATRVEVERMIAAEDAQVAARMQATQKELEQVERLALAKSEAQDVLREQLAAHPEVPHGVLEFLAQHWIKYLVVVRARDGAASEAWRAAAEATGKLLWSVEPKPTIEDHRALTRSIPPLLKAIKAGVAAGNIDEAASSAFLQELMKCHTAALRAATQVPPAKGKEAKASARPAQPEFAFTRAVTVQNPFGGGAVQVSEDDLDFTGIAPADPAAPAMAVDAPDKAERPKRPAQRVRLPSTMEVGTWVSVEDPQTRHSRPARLHYVSPLKSHFLFVDRQGNKVFECSRTMLARRLKLGEVLMLDGEPDASLFDRIMESLFGKLGKSGAKAGLAPALAPA